MMILGYKKSDGQSDPYWFSNQPNPETGKPDIRKFIRVCAGLAIPVLDRQHGAIAVIGELYRPTGPVDFTVLDAYVGDEWKLVENQLYQFRRDMKYEYVIVDKEEAREVVWRTEAYKWGIGEIPLGTDTAPAYALSEVGRSKVDALINEGRLHISEETVAAMNAEPETARIALCAVVVWCADISKAHYRPLREAPRGGGRILGLEGL